MSDVNFGDNNLLHVHNFLVITKIKESGQVQEADIMSARLLVESGKLEQAVANVTEGLC